MVCRSGLLLPDQLKSLDIWQMLCERFKWDGHRLSEIDNASFHTRTGWHYGRGCSENNQSNVFKNAIFNRLRMLSGNLTTLLSDSSNEQKKRNRALKDFLYENMYYHYRIVRMKNRADNFLGRLFETMSRTNSITALLSGTH